MLFVHSQLAPRQKQDDRKKAAHTMTGRKQRKRGLGGRLTLPLLTQVTLLSRPHLLRAQSAKAYQGINVLMSIAAPCSSHLSKAQFLNHKAFERHSGSKPLSCSPLVFNALYFRVKFLPQIPLLRDPEPTARCSKTQEFPGTFCPKGLILVFH